MLAISQVAGLVVVAALVAARGEPPPALPELLPAAGAGTAGLLALAAFYRALAIGTMSIVAPVAATGAVVPVAVGLAAGEAPGELQLVGIAAAVAGVVLASREEDGSAAAGGEPVALALLAALGFGTFFVGMDSAAEADVLWALLVARSCAVALLVLGMLALRRGARAGPAALAPLALVGLLDVSANGLFALASTQGLLSLVAVTGSLYPVVTVLLARAVLAERVRAVQGAGVVLALGGVVLIAAG